LAKKPHGTVTRQKIVPPSRKCSPTLNWPSHPGIDTDHSSAWPLPRPGDPTHDSLGGEILNTTCQRQKQQAGMPGQPLKSEALIESDRAFDFRIHDCSERRNLGVDQTVD
jgi:hypothetical protein